MGQRSKGLFVSTAVRAVKRSMPTNDRKFIETLHKIEEHLAAMRDGSERTPHEWLTIQEVADELRV